MTNFYFSWVSCESAPAAKKLASECESFLEGECMLVQDVDTTARFLFLEASRRLGDSWTLEAEIRIFMDQPPSDFLFDLRDDDLLQLALQYHF